ncbi:helix-turn-helix domain-containing protein [Epilithonimonas lactis]|uniref:HTH araC/xylS-type domain-containing protein n=2 Tax=Epilithonimonas lactis TaxID=421072 RepID=A0A085BG96_9FLAO|nr:AraC family transcriptional regulator [Epilithonimonas lactis]KFC21491.1 hypothetical protein IO89_15050 [Epilithonimonas lactis]SEP86978.1 AraC-type DNA-binding protein [Epilithonimonas lactis]
MGKFYFLIGILFFELPRAQSKDHSDNQIFSKDFQHSQKNADRTLEIAKGKIRTAKKKKKYAHMANGYQDAVFSSHSKEVKLKYADSAVVAALLSKNDHVIANAFLLRGKVYHYSFRQYKDALDDYIMAFDITRYSADAYLQNDLSYHISILKCNLGYFESAYRDLQKTTAFFKRNQQTKRHQKVHLQNVKAYYNSLHQMIVCLRHLRDLKPIDSLIGVGLDQTQNRLELQLEYGLFLKEQGIEQFRKKNMDSAIRSLKRSLEYLSVDDDLTWEPVNYFHIGQIYLASGEQHRAIGYFQKIDSVFQKHHQILPGVRESYELLINYYKAQNDVKKELYYTRQLLKVDRVLSQDVNYLSSTIHRRYDTARSVLEKETSERPAEIALVVCLILASASIIVIVIRKMRNEKKAKNDHWILENKILDNAVIAAEKIDQQLSEGEGSILNEETSDNILAKLKIFEEATGFTEQGLTLHKLASRLETNSNYLSHVINQYKGMNFCRYIGELRIKYITEKLENDKTYLSYKIEYLGHECGISSRTNFSNLFREINGIRPKDFIKNRLRKIRDDEEALKINK